MRILSFAMGLCLVTALPTFAQPNNDQEKEFDPALVRAGNDLVEGMPEIPSKVDEKYFYEVKTTTGGTGWAYIELDKVRKRGEELYRYRSQYAIDGITYDGIPGIWLEGKSEYWLKHDFSPVRCVDDFLLISPQIGKNDVVHKAVFKDGEMKTRRDFRLKYVDETKTVPENNVVMLLEPLFDKLDLENGQKFVLNYYDPLENDFGAIEYEALKREGNEFRISTKQWYKIIDPNNQNQGDPNNPNSDRRKVREGYIIVDGRGAFKKKYDARLDITIERSDKDRVIEIRKKMHESLQDDD